MVTKYRFALTGTGQQFVACAELLRARQHRIVGVLSACPEVSAWAERRGVERASDLSSENRWLDGVPFDYLVSIVNHAVLPAEVIAAPERFAINYHDSLLPHYAGFNATAWAILDGRASHGVTWHRMSMDVDRGDVLVQQAVEISEDDTAFTLGVKCSEAGVASFGTLLDQIENDRIEARPQEGDGSVHLRSERPGVALLDFTRTAQELQSIVRGLNFGSDDNWMARPKLWTPAGVLAVGEARVESSRSASPGTILAVTTRGIAIATASGALWLSEFTTLDGRSVGPVQAATRLLIVEGQRMPTLDAAIVSAANDLDAVLTKSERFWVKRVGDVRAASLSDLRPHDEAKIARTIERALPASLAGASAEVRDSTLIAALAAYVARLGGGDTFDFAWRTSLSDVLVPFFASVAPLRSTVVGDEPFSAVVDRTRNELATLAKRATFARDALSRYKSLRGVTSKSLAMPIGIWCADGNAFTARDALREDVHLTLVTRAGSGYAWVYDAMAVSERAATMLADRFDQLLAGAVAAPETTVSTLPLLPRAERELLLETWQATDREFESDVCVHQHFEKQVERTPAATAVVFDDVQLTYRELNARANRLAHALRGAGVGPETLVGVCVERSLDMIVSLLGILKAGGAYVPLDPAYPADRLAIMLEDSKAAIVVTQSHLVDRVPPTGAQLVFVDRIDASSTDVNNPSSGVQAENLAYVIFTSGSTGRPKGIMVEHRNVSNFFAGMDDAVGTTPGVWLAVTSISFDISVLELFWTLARGFKVIIAPEGDRASITRRDRAGRTPSQKKPMGFGLFYFAADSGAAEPGNAYRLLIEGAKFADAAGFEAVWTPERHFHAFGGLYPNPSVTTAALATITNQIALRAGSVVLPLHNPLRVAEEWAVIDQLSNGRVGLSFASGWHVNDFAFMPDNFERRRDVMYEHIETVYKLWRGEKVSAKNGAGETIEVSVLPRPVQAKPPLWIAAAGSPSTFVQAGKIGANILTNMLGQDLADLERKFAAYRAARREAGHEGDGIISVMLHTFICDDTEEARRLARKPFSDYLGTSFDLVKVAPQMFPAFKQPSRANEIDSHIDGASFTDDDMEALLEHAFDRYFDTAGLFGTPERAMDIVEQLAAIGATEVACLIDFGIASDVVLANLPHLARLRDLCRERAASAPARMPHAQVSIGDLLHRYQVTHLQCTPSMARALANDAAAHSGLVRLQKLLLGGEALPADLAEQMAGAVSGAVLNMYGPTETAVWSTTSTVSRGSAPTIGRPIANTTIRILDENRQLAPIGTPGELWIGGKGVARGYFGRSDLTDERFIADPWTAGARLYRTGDLARYRDDGEIEFLGRLDHQVKVHGFRIELGEIETALTTHRGVREGVVVARVPSADGTPALVAYVVPQRGVHKPSDADRVLDWQNVWDETYQRTRLESSANARFRIAGWNDSYTGEPIPAPQMREWLDATIQRIVALSPRRVLEIGCGSGMILFGLLPSVEHYTGVDISGEALDSIRRELTEAEAAKVTLRRAAADELDGMAPGSFDLVVINSVAQYFPNAGYLTRVLGRATELVTDGGQIFVGDVRSLAHLGAFRTSVELHQAAGSMSGAELRERIDSSIARESELLLSEAFFEALVRETPRLARADVELKRGASHNELTRFRYDVVLHVGPKPTTTESMLSPMCAATLDDIRAVLADEPAAVYFADVPNARLAGVAAAERALTSPTVVADQLRSAMESARDRGVDPEVVYTLDNSYDVRLRWAQSGDASRFDALLRHKSRGMSEGWPVEAPVRSSNSVYANEPASAVDDAAITTQLRAHLRRTLPEYMVPTTFVMLDELPLTPNGKIDRKALPEPERRVRAPSASYAPPSNTLEQQIAEIWQELLGLERVGRRDNIFDLGANSLLTMQANNRLSTLLGRKVSLVSMFRYPTVESLAAHLGEAPRPLADADRRAQDRASRADKAAERRRTLRAERSDR